MDIFTAAVMGNVGLLKQHVEAGTDLELRDSLGVTPLIVAAFSATLKLCGYSSILAPI